MKTDLNHSHQVPAHVNRAAGIAPSDAGPLVRGTRHTRLKRREIVRYALGENPERDLTPIPIPEAMARAAALLKSLSVVTNAMRADRAKL